MPQIQTYYLHETKMLTIDIPHSLQAPFREMVQRATNLWPDAPPEIKHFADMITNGRPMQDYFAQQDFKPRQQ